MIIVSAKLCFSRLSRPSSPLKPLLLLCPLKPSPPFALSLPSLPSLKSLKAKPSCRSSPLKPSPPVFPRANSLCNNRAVANFKQLFLQYRGSALHPNSGGGISLEQGCPDVLQRRARNQTLQFPRGHFQDLQAIHMQILISQCVFWATRTAY